MTTAVAQARVLLVDDNLSALRALEYVLDRDGLQVECAASGEIALERLRSDKYDVVLTDLRMPGLDGVELLRAIRAEFPELPVIILTAHGSIDNAVNAVRLGAYDYLQKPFLGPELVHRVRKALEKQGLVTEVRRLKAKVAEGRGTDAIVGSSPAMQKILSQIQTVADKEISVVIYGESGTGKELAARALHQASPRRNRPFVAVNCAAIPESLLENELFGHVRGAYTGASNHHRGLFEEAHTGTIFLDEIGDIPLVLQAKLLRVLQEQEFKKLGGNREVRVDVRLITATNRDLREAVAAGRFREDLYYRINVVPIHLPALRERAEDIPLLANYFRNLFNDELGLSIQGFADDALCRMTAFEWPGNIRELRNRVKRAMVMAHGTLLTAEDLGLEPAGKSIFPAFRDARDEFEREYIARALRVSGGNVKKAAQLAGRDRSTFYDLLKKHAIEADAYRSAP